MTNPRLAGRTALARRSMDSELVLDARTAKGCHDVELPEQSRLGGLVLDDGLDGQVDAQRTCLKIAGHGDARHGGSTLQVGQSAAVHHALQGGRDPNHPGCRTLVIRLV